ncbi:HTH domain-containing protein [Georgenia sp. SUBG003]|uniref:HTH domain-containing protein n=1 Tax=Georgenia sp. SUBG003 TaxID=1497974 RepID=UPI000ABF15F2
MSTAERQAPETEASTRERVLELVVEQGPVSAATLARVLELTPAAVRRHIAHLEEAGQIVVHEPGGPGVRRRGRPARHYVATDAGRSVLTDAYSDLATHALDFLVQVAGPRGARELRRGARHRARAAVPPARRAGRTLAPGPRPRPRRRPDRGRLRRDHPHGRRAGRRAAAVPGALPGPGRRRGIPAAVRG